MEWRSLQLGVRREHTHMSINRWLGMLADNSVSAPPRLPAVDYGVGLKRRRRRPASTRPELPIMNTGRMGKNMTGRLIFSKLTLCPRNWGWSPKHRPGHGKIFDFQNIRSKTHILLSGQRQQWVGRSGRSPISASENSGTFKLYCTMYMVHYGYSSIY